MSIDQQALEKMEAGEEEKTRVRFFQWSQPVITYGYLLDENRVRSWSLENGGLEMVRRPTGGGAVIHTTEELALSFLWPRQRGLLPDHPQKAYAAIHRALKEGVENYLEGEKLNLFVPETKNPRAFTICFDEPVCNDVMRQNKKIIGGALRITSQAVLYQGTIQLTDKGNIQKLKDCLRAAIQTPETP